MTISHNGRVELSLGSLTYKDAGVYTCVATNEVGRAETSSRVEINERPPTEVSIISTEQLPKVIAQDIP